MRRFAALVQEGGFFGPRLTVADLVFFHLAEVLHDNELDAWRRQPALVELVGRVAERPLVRRYLHSGHRFPAQPYPR